MDNSAGVDPTNARLDTIIRLLAVSITEGKDSREQIAILKGAGLGPKEIGEILGMTANSVSVALTRMKKGRSGGR